MTRLFSFCAYKDTFTWLAYLSVQNDNLGRFGNIIMRIDNIYLIIISKFID